MLRREKLAELEEVRRARGRKIPDTLPNMPTPAPTASPPTPTPLAPAQPPPAWVVEMFRAIDEADSDAFLDFLTEDATFRFGNAPEVRGREAIAAAVEGFWGSIDGSEHALSACWTGPGVAVCHGIVTYTRHDGSTLTVPFADVFRLEEGREDERPRLREYLIFADVSEL